MINAGSFLDDLKIAKSHKNFKDTKVGGFLSNVLHDYIDDGKQYIEKNLPTVKTDVSISKNTLFIIGALLLVAIIGFSKK